MIFFCLYCQLCFTLVSYTNGTMKHKNRIVIENSFMRIENRIPLSDVLGHISKFRSDDYIDRSMIGG